MITLETLPGDKGSLQKRRRVGRGRGSGHGKTSGRGHKGSQSRSGSRTRMHYEGGQTPMQRRLPKRGFNNKAFAEPMQIVNLSALERVFEDGGVVDLASLAGLRLIADGEKPVKVLGAGVLTKRLTVRAHAFSATARAAIEARGGVCESL
jgi:large subunit ribosomal protein L15